MPATEHIRNAMANQKRQGKRNCANQHSNETLANAAKRGNLNKCDQATDAVESMWDDLHEYQKGKVLLPLF